MDSRSTVVCVWVTRPVWIRTYKPQTFTGSYWQILLQKVPVVSSRPHHVRMFENINKLELWVTSLSDTPRLQYYDVQTLEYRYISKLPMKNERIWSYVKETTSHLQNKLTKNICR